MLTPLDIAVAIAGVVGVQAKDLLPIVIRAVNKGRDSRSAKEAMVLKDHRAAISRGDLIDELVREYYRCSDESEWLFWDYSLQGRTLRSTHVGPRNTCLPATIVRPTTRDASLVERHGRQMALPIQTIEELVRQIEILGIEIWEEESYALRGFQPSHRHPFEFSKESFLAYRYSVGLLEDELFWALSQRHYSVLDVVADREALLKLRNAIAPTVKELKNYRDRICLGGPMAVFAVARPKPHDDYVFYCQKRKSTLSDGAGRTSPIPRGYHESFVDANVEVSLSQSLFRELSEEVYGGQEVDGRMPGKALDPDYFWYRQPMQWLREHPDTWTAQLTSFGIDAVKGNYTAGYLLAVHDPDYWNLHLEHTTPNWESESTLRISTRDRSQLERRILQEKWTGDSLPCLLEGLLRLREHAPNRVDLPLIERNWA